MIAEINLTAVTLLGRDRNRLLNKSLRTLVMAADMDRWVRHLMLIKQQHGKGSIELSLQRGDGTVFQAQLDCVGNAAMVRITLSDITERKLAENEFRLMQFSIDHAPDAVYRMSPEGRFLYVNKMACQTLGYSAEELLTMGVADIDPSLPFACSLEMAHATKIAGNTKIESEHRSKDGRTFPLEVLVSYFPPLSD